MTTRTTKPIPAKVHIYFTGRPLTHSSANHRTKITIDVLKFGCKRIHRTTPKVSRKLAAIQRRSLRRSFVRAKKSARTIIMIILAISEGWIKISPVSSQRADPKIAVPKI